MQNLLLVDSSFYIRRMRSGGDPLAELAGISLTHEIATCGMIMLEVLRGIRNERTLSIFQTGFSSMVYLSSSRLVWKAAASIGHKLDRKGIILPAPDLLIAACAMDQDAMLLTFDQHFAEIPGLRLMA